MLILIYSHLIETCKLSSSKFKYVVLLLGILKSVMWERHTLGGPFKDNTDNKFFNQWQSSFYTKALLLVYDFHWKWAWGFVRKIWSLISWDKGMSSFPSFTQENAISCNLSEESGENWELAEIQKALSKTTFLSPRKNLSQGSQLFFSRVL